GLVMTDDLDMGAIYYHYSVAETIRMAIMAGNDMAMMCHRIDALDEAYRVLAHLPLREVDRALANIGRFKSGMRPPHEFSEAAFRNFGEEVWRLRVAVLGPEKAAERSPEDGKRSPTENLGEN